MKSLLITLALCLCSSARVMLSATNYYSCDFENDTDNARWGLTPTISQSIADLITNKWYIGAPGNYTPGGQNGLYISDDNGVSAHYSPHGCWSIAYDIVTLPVLEDGDYTLLFDYCVTSNEVTNEGLYVLWIPMTDRETGDSIKVLSNASFSGVPPIYNEYVIPTRVRPYVYSISGPPVWRQYVVDIPRNLCSADPHYLVFAWANGNTQLQHPVVMIDNIEIVDTLCEAPTNLSVNYINDQHILSWSGYTMPYEVSAYSSDTQQWYGPYEVSDTSYIFSDLPSSATDFIVRSKCGNNGYSRKAFLSKTIYYPNRMCIDYMNLNDALCYVENSTPDNSLTFDDYKIVSPVDYGPDKEKSCHTVHWNKYETDPRTGGMAYTIPEGELASVRLGNWSADNHTERIEYFIVIDTTEASVLHLKYLPILEAPSHEDYMNPRFQLAILIDNGISIDTCEKADFNANDVMYINALTPEAEAQGWHITSYNITQTSTNVVWKEWTTVGINLQKPKYQGKTMTIQLTTHDCAYTAHSGYAYFTLGCADRKLKVKKNETCAYEFTAPEGFIYRWYRASDKEHRNAKKAILEDMILGHEQSFVIDEEDQNTYAVDCMFVQDSTNYFTLFATALAIRPVPVLGYEQDSLDLTDSTYTFHFDASNSYVAEIHPLDTTVSTRYIVDSVRWNLDDGKTTDAYSIDYKIKAPVSHDTTLLVSLTAYSQGEATTDTVRLNVASVPQKSEGLADAPVPTLFPTVVSAGQQIPVKWTTPAKIRFITITGIICYCMDLYGENAFITTPSVPGLYVMECISTQGGHYTQQFIVQ